MKELQISVRAIFHVQAVESAFRVYAPVAELNNHLRVWHCAQLFEGVDLGGDTFALEV